jgi:DNA polymerase III alpha subunit
MIRTGYSFRTAIGHLPEVMSRLKEEEFDCAPIADRMSTYAFVRWTKLAAENDLRPVYGVEIGVTPELGTRRQTLDYWTFMAKDNIRDLNELIYLATSNPGREPCLTYEQALAAPLWKVSGPALLVDHLAFTNRPRKDFFVGLSPATPRGLVLAAKGEKLTFAATSNNFYPREEDRELYRVMIKGGSTQTYPMHIVGWRGLGASLASHGEVLAREAIRTSRRLLAASQAHLEKAHLLVPSKPRSLRQLCEEGARRTGINLRDPVYAARLKKELRLIAEKDFEDYFHIVADLMMWSREKMIVGPARGSSCGSLVCYLLGITSVDPIPHGLIFERFIDTTRKDLPDIDLDFSDVNRHLVFEYMDETYGRNRSARLGSVSMLKAKAALKLVGAALRIPSSRIDEIANTVIKRSTGDSRASSTIEDTFNDTDTGRRFIDAFPEARILARIENHPSNAAQHAAGVVLTRDAVTDFVAINARTGAAMCDLKDATELNLLKIDALGLTQLSIFERTLELVGLPPRTSTLEKIPLDDARAFDILNDFRFAGIFQFEIGTASSHLTEHLIKAYGGKITKFDDIASLTAIVRPGPLGSGAADEWLKRRAGKSKVTYAHPSLEPYLKDTYGMIIYQEQVLNISREIGGLSWDDATQLRKAMSKSLGKEYFDQFGDRWKAGAKKNVGMEKGLADRLWNDLCTFGMWAFNKSHSVAYGIVTYWCCWLKSRYPLEFAAATLDAQVDPQLQISFLRELDREGIRYVAVDPERSTDRWDVGENVLVGPLTNIVGIGPKNVRDILTARRGGKPLTPSLAARLASSRTPIDSLTPIADACSRCGLDGIATAPTPIADLAMGQWAMIMGQVTKVSPKNDNDAAAVAKRGYKLRGPEESLNLFVRDDTGEIFCKVNRYRFEDLGRQFIEKGPGSLWAIKGSVPADFRMVRVDQVRYIGQLKEGGKPKAGQS